MTFLKPFTMIQLPEYVKELLKKFAEGDISSSETDTLLELLVLYEEEEITQMLYEINQDIDLNRFRDSTWQATPFQELLDRINKIPVQKTHTRRKFSFNQALQISFLIVFIGTIIWVEFYRPPLEYSCGSYAAGEIPTGRFSCMVTLANGCVVKVDSNYHGSVIDEGNIQITEPESGLLLCTRKKSQGKTVESSGMYNTITVARGEQYRVILPDGSRIRLNAESSIRFPVAFDSARDVDINGEAYFEVAPDPHLPFYVKAGNGLIKVFGTRFNVNAYYPNTVTTLLSGSLEITTQRNKAKLKPGEQALVYGCRDCPGLLDSLIQVKHPDTAQVVSWKKVNRIYSNISLRELVTDVGRWYDLEIVSIACVPNVDYSGSLCYDAPLEDVLKLFHKMKLNFKLEGRRIIFCKPG
jgi:transmembrane sensor